MAALPPPAGEQPVEARNGHVSAAPQPHKELAPLSFYPSVPPAQVRLNVEGGLKRFRALSSLIADIWDREAPRQL
jgi:hypothetical protein